MKAKEFWERIKNEDLINRARCSVVDYPLHGDSGRNEVSIYYSQKKKCYVREEPVERSNSVYSFCYKDEDEAYDSVYRHLVWWAEYNER